MSNNNNQKFKKQHGITLAALIISVILMLILVSVALTQITGEGGLIARSNYAAVKYNTSAENEDDDIDYLKGLYSNTVKGYVEPFEYTVIFDANGGTGTMVNQTMTYGISAKLTANTFEKTGSVFTGWNTAANGSGTWYKDGQSVKNLTNTEGTEITLYAQWGISVKYAVQIYGINQDVDANDNTLGLTFGPATGDNYNNKYVTHRYEETSSGSGVYNVVIVTHTVAANGSETTAEEYLLDSSSNNVTITEDQYKARKDINLHDMTWAQIAAVSDKTVFEDCMLCGDTKSVTLNLNSVIASGNSYTQYGDGAGGLSNTIDLYYRKWNPNASDNSYIGIDVTLDSNETSKGSNARNAGGYSSSHIRATLIGKENAKTINGTMSQINKGYAGNVNLTTDTCLYSCIQSDLQNVITEKKIRYLTGSSSRNYGINDDIKDKIWLLSLGEMYGIATGNGGGTMDAIGVNEDAYNKFTNTKSKYYIQDGPHGNASNFRKVYYENNANYRWWLRTPSLSDSYRAFNIYSAGRSTCFSCVCKGSGGETSIGLAFGFCIR